MKIAAYCRVSTDSGEQLESIENQKIFFNDFAEKNNFQLIKIYADEGISGKQMKNRTEFLKMLDDAKSGVFDMVVVKDISRFARNTVDFLNSIRGLKTLGIDVKFLSNNQTILGDSEFILTIFSAMAQEESANLSKRVKFGKKINAQKGRVPTRVYGYNRIDNFTLIPDEYESSVVNRIFDMYVNRGCGAGKIAKSFSEEGIPSKLTESPYSWNSKTIRRILTNSIYIGKHVNNKYEIKDYLTGERGKLPENQHICHKRPEFRIISDEIYYKAQEKMKRNHEIYKNKYTHITGRDSARHIFSTLIRCENCELAYSRKSYTYKNTRTYWICTGFNNRGLHFCDNRIKIEESEMIEFLKDYFKSLIANQINFIEEVASGFSKEFIDSSSEFDFNKVDKQIKKTEAEKEKFKTMYLNNIIDIDELKASVFINDKKINELKSKVAEAEQMFKKKENTEALSKELYSEIESMLNIESWTNVDLKRIIDKISVDKEGEVNIYLRKI